jgi:Ca2+-binding EF-hand superfamily protein
LKERVGTLYSMAPCMLVGRGYTCLADMWSVGVVTYTVLSGGIQPFCGKTPKQVVARILQCDYSFDVENDDFGEGGCPNDAWTNVSEEAKAFIQGLLRLQPEERFTAQQAIRHDWIRRRLASEPRLSTAGSTASTAPVGSGGTAADPSLKERVASGMVRYAEWASDFRKLALNAVAKRSTSDEIFEIRKVFDEFDTENTGTITLDEFRAALSQFGPSSYPEPELREMFSKIGIGGTLVINYTEFLAAALEAQGNIEEWRLAEAFAVLDRDGSGCISRSDLRRVVGPLADESYLDQLIEQAGGSPSAGRISYADFLRAFGMQTQDLVYDMYQEAYPVSSTIAAEEFLERRGVHVPDAAAASQALDRRRFRGALQLAASSAGSAVTGSLRLISPISRDDLVGCLLTGRPAPRFPDSKDAEGGTDTSHSSASQSSFDVVSRGGGDFGSSLARRSLRMLIAPASKDDVLRYISTGRPSFSDR